MKINKIDVDKLSDGTLSPGSLRAYQAKWDGYEAFAGSVDKALRPETFAAYREHLIRNTEYSRASINLTIMAIRSISSMMYNRDMLSGEAESKFRRVAALGPRTLGTRGKLRHPVYIAPDEMRRIVDVAVPDPNDPRSLMRRAAILVLATTGLRIGEVANLKVSSIVQVGTNYMLRNVIVKGNKFHDTPLSPEAYGAIMDWLAKKPIQSEYVFNGFDYHPEMGIAYSDKPASREHIHDIVKDVVTEAGFPNVKPHDFRRFVGTQLARKDLRLAQKVLGHSSIETTARYYILDRVPAGVTNDIF